MTLKPGSTCIVASGILHDPYTGKTLNFVRGPRSAAVQIDHVVALDDAWRSGAAAWTAARRFAYANSRLVLLAVDGPANEDKGCGRAVVGVCACLASGRFPLLRGAAVSACVRCCLRKQGAV